MSLPFILFFFKMPLEKIVNKLAKGVNLTKHTFRHISKKAVSYIPKIRVIKEHRSINEYLTPVIHPQYKFEEEFDSELSNKNENYSISDNPTSKNEEYIFPSLFEEARDYIFVDRFTQQIRRKVVPVTDPLDVLKEKRVIYAVA